MSKITIEQKQAELESNESMVMEYLALFNNGDHIVERKGNRFLIANQNLFCFVHIGSGKWAYHSNTSKWVS